MTVFREMPWGNGLMVVNVVRLDIFMSKTDIKELMPVNTIRAGAGVEDEIRRQEKTRMRKERTRPRSPLVDSLFIVVIAIGDQCTK
jgi:hypothetical protein